MRWHQLHWCKRRGTKITHTHTHTHTRRGLRDAHDRQHLLNSMCDEDVMLVNYTETPPTPLPQPIRRRATRTSTNPLRRNGASCERVDKAVNHQTHVKQTNLQDVSSLTCFFQSRNRKKRRKTRPLKWNYVTCFYRRNSHRDFPSAFVFDFSWISKTFNKDSMWRSWIMHNLSLFLDRFYW